MPAAHVHESHAEVVNRLKRAGGHLQTIVAMIDSGRDCLDIAQQLQAVVKAVEGAKSVLIHDHVEHCLEAAMGPTTRDQRATIEQFKKITRYL
ncbi:MAG: metal-sensing transcriptional repressor [Gammaproteobacteria bacterium]|nr:metal-sensing transcriptional repressor [Gammaproteobacteria bacterium]